LQVSEDSVGRTPTTDHGALDRRRVAVVASDEETG
jgi:hypothetical protein